MPEHAIEGIPSSVVCRLAHLPPSTLDYWVRTRLVTPSLRGSEGKRVERWWTVDEALAVKTVRALRQAGASLQQVRRALRIVADSGTDLNGLVLHWDGADLVQLLPDGTIASTMRAPGQTMLFEVVLPVGTWRREMSREALPVDLADFRQKRRARRKRQQSYRLPTAEGEAS